MWFIFVILAKNWKGWSDNVETFQKEKSGVFEKNLENENFIAAALHCENWYLKQNKYFHYFPGKDVKYS